MLRRLLTASLEFIRTRYKRIISSITVVILFCYVEESVKTHQQYEEPFNVKCHHFAIHRKEIIRITQIVHDILERHNVTHFLMYGSLWGPLRGYQGPLPWDYDVDFGSIYSEEVESKMVQVVRDIKRHGLKVQNDVGKYRFYNTNPPVRIKPGKSPVIDFFLFKPSLFGLTWRLGKESWFLFVHYYLHHTFPHRLVQGELPKVRFADRLISVPKNGSEIIKYLYRFNWRKVVKPPGFNCTDNEILNVT